MVVPPETTGHTFAVGDTTTLWERFHGELTAYLRSRRTPEGAVEDLLQETFLRAHRSLAAGEHPEHPRAWLFQIVRNLSVDAARRRDREARASQALSYEPPVTEPESADVDAFALVARSLPMFIEALAPIYRDALRMTELEGLTQAEAARRAGVSVSGMKSRVQRGRKQVFEALQRCCAFEVDGRGRMVSCRPHGADEACC